ncbi:TPA: homoserine dehydrogenase [bacterium]|nr:homoserine dehydrogenase [bacterium]
MREIKIGIIGLGTVGTGVMKILSCEGTRLQKHSGVRFTVKRVADLDITRDRGIQIEPEILTTDAKKIIDDEEIEVVVELIGGCEPAKSYILGAIQKGKHIVTANKALLACHWEEIQDRAKEHGVEILLEGAVGGGIPIIRSITSLLTSNKIRSIFGIINGTCNYILATMAKEGRNFDEALQRAREKGYAEADPSLDIEGVDTAHKLVILASLAFKGGVTLKDVYVEGISKITPQDILYAREEFGHCIKLLGVAKEWEDTLEIRVHPTMIPENHPLSDVDGVNNAIYLEGDNVGSLIFSGQGAGQMPTASSVVSDLVSLAQRIDRPSNHPLISDVEPRKKVRPIKELKTKYYVRFTTLDQPGVLAAISSTLAKYRISIASVIQKERGPEGPVPIVMLTHEAEEESMVRAISEIDRLEIVKAETLLIRCEEMTTTN